MVAQMVKHLPTTQETQVRSLGWEDPLEKALAPNSSPLAWKIPWTEEHGRLQSMGSQRLDTTDRLHFLFFFSFSEVILQKEYPHLHWINLSTWVQSLEKNLTIRNTGVKVLLIYFLCKEEDPYMVESSYHERKSYVLKPLYHGHRPENQSDLGSSPCTY